MTPKGLSVQTLFDHEALDFAQPGKQLYEVAFHYDGAWGNALVPLAIINGTAGPGRSVACFGGTHGNEYEGQIAIWRLMHELDPAGMCGRVILMPRLNTPAARQGTRESPADGVNMNRAFPGDPHGSLTYRIADFVTSRVFPWVDIVLDIHAAGRGMQFALCTSFHDVADPAQRAAMAATAALFDTPFILIYSSEMARGLLTDEAEAQGKITIGGEFGFAEGVLPQGLKHAYGGIKNVLRHFGILSGEVERIVPERSNTPLLVEARGLDSYIPAPFSGVYEPLYEVGQAVQAGQQIGRLYDFDRVGALAQTITAPRAGYLLLQPFQAPINKGDTMIVVAAPVADGA